MAVLHDRLSIFRSTVAYCPVHLAKSIVLIGFMGAGKSSVGRCLQRLTGLARVDTDELVIAKFEMPIVEIFSKYGEERFREAETEVLRQFQPDRSAIVVTGGGTILKNENVDLLRRLGAVVWLDANEDVLFERASRKNERPLLQTEDPRGSFARLLATRRPLYERATEIKIDTSGLSHEEVAEVILQKIENSTLGDKWT